MLHYLGEFICENAVNEDLQEIHEMVGSVRRDSETSLAYWKMMEELNRSTSEGRKKGLAEGRAEGRAEGEAYGSLYRLTVQVCRKMKMNQSLERIAEDLVEESSVIEPIYNAAREFAPEYDPSLVFQKINVDKLLVYKKTL